MAKILTGPKVANAETYNIYYKHSDNTVLTITGVEGGSDEKTFYFNLIDEKITQPDGNNVCSLNSESEHQIKNYLIPGRTYNIGCQAVPKSNDIIWTESLEGSCGDLKMETISIELVLQSEEGTDLSPYGFIYSFKKIESFTEAEEGKDYERYIEPFDCEDKENVYIYPTYQDTLAAFSNYSPPDNWESENLDNSSNTSYIKLSLNSGLNSQKLEIDISKINALAT